MRTDTPTSSSPDDPDSEYLAFVAASSDGNAADTPAELPAVLARARGLLLALQYACHFS